MIWTAVLFAVGGYLLGSIPVGLVVGKLLKGVDIREYGSGKTGTTNTLRTLGRGPAVLVLVLDFLKGALPVLIAKLVTDDAMVQVAGALGAIAGHDWPLYARFRGGRGVATSFGATVAMMPPLGLVLPLIAAAILWPWRIVSLMSVLATVIAAVIVGALAATERVPDEYTLFGVVAAALIVILHRENIGRLLAGTEPKLGQGGTRRGGRMSVTSAPRGRGQ
jgi:acyl phosphate:glycerol-3-phosphate acyltransferase